jgi:D-psicose/D-tagatose/L-ribulose 3-epimerase
MKFGVNTFVWGASFEPADFQRLPRIRERGFDGVELPVLDPLRFKADSIRRELDKYDLECTTVSIVPAGQSLASPDAVARAKGRRHLNDVMAASRDVGSKLLSGPLYTPVGEMTGVRRTDDEWKRVVAAWQQLGRVAQEAGIEVGLEPLNRFETYFLNTAADGVRLCRDIADPSIGLLFDTFHANIEEKSIGAAARQAAPYLKHLHACENDRGTPGSGHVAWTEFFEAITDIGYDRWMTIESFGFALGSMSAAAAIWRDLAATPEAIPFDGLTFLRAHAIGAAV